MNLYVPCLLDRFTARISLTMNPRILFFLSIVVLLGMPIVGYSQVCQTNVDLNTWVQEGNPATGNWQVNPAGTSVLQTVNVIAFNSYPTFFVSPDTFHNARIEGTIRVNSGLGDDDWIGFVFGYQNPVGNIDQYDTYLFDWKKETQAFGALNGQEGMALTHIQGPIPQANLWNYIWGHNSDAIFNVLDTDYGPGRGWEFDIDYDFTLIYTSTRATILIDADTIFDISGCFDRGRFGFYNFSQSNVLYSNFRYSLETNFDPLVSNVCIGDSAYFQFTDTCFGDANTTANLALWNWDFGDGTTSTDLNPAHAYTTFGPKTVSLIVEDVNGCRDTVTEQILIHPSPHPLAAPQDTAICPGDSALIFSVDTFPITPVNFIWAPGGAQTGLLLATPAATTTYTVTATNLCGVSTMSTTVTVVPPLDLTATTVDATCAGASDGTIQITPGGGAGGYNFAWTPTLPNTASPAGLDTGAYSLTLTDAIGCSLDTLFTIAEPTALSGSVTAISHVDCNGATTGSITLAGAGGTAGYSYSSDGVNFSANPNVLTLGAGPYTFTILDANGCTFTLADTIDEPAALLLSVSSQTNPTCSGSATGSVTLSGTGGTGTYEYSQDGITFGTNPTFSNLGNGNYTFTIRDANNCQSTVSAILADPNPLLGTLITQTDPSCAGTSDGLLVVSASGGTPNYSYSIDGINFGTNPAFSNLPAGNYTLSIQDQSGCILPLAATLSDPPVLAIALDSLADINCFGETNGFIEVSASGGTGLYNFSLDGLSFFEADTFPTLGVGSYSIIVRDGSGCLDTLTTSIAEPTQITAVTSIVQPISCAGAGDGELQVVANGGTGAYSYFWDPLAVLSSTVNSLDGGLYTAIVADANGCLAADSVTLDEPELIVISLDSLANIRCEGEDNGYAAYSVTGGITPFAYSWDGGGGPNSPFNANLTPGTHFLTLTDANGCIVSTDPVTIDEPQALAIVLSPTDASCANLSDGTAMVSISGGTEPYAATWQGVPGGTVGGFNVLNLPAGTYSVEVTDANGCVTQGNTSIASPPVLALELVDQTDAFCDLANGDALVVADGGNPGYTYAWNTVPPQEGPQAMDIPEGTFTVTVTDNLGCEEMLEVLIANEGTPTAAFTTNVDLTSGEPILLDLAQFEFANESTGAIAYFWDFGTGTAFSDEDNPRFAYTEPGTYTVVLTAIDPNNTCPDEDSLTFTLIERGTVYMANAFSPNGDGHNDEFMFGGQGIVNFECIIFNRWGTEVARFNDIDQGWDGTSQNQSSVPEGVYMYVLKAELNTGEQIERGGSITLFR